MNNDSKTESRSRSNEPAEDEIRRRAYELFQRRGGQPGRDKDDWNQAAKELREERLKGQKSSVTPQSQTAPSYSQTSSSSGQSSGQDKTLPAKAPATTPAGSQVGDTSSAKSKKR